MSQEKLRVLRLLIPGILLFVLIPPIFTDQFDADSLVDQFWSSQTVGFQPPPLSLVVSMRFSTCEPSQGPSAIRRINGNIHHQLLAACSEDSLVASANETLRSGRTLMHIFYKFVDRDPTLQEKAKRVRFNGLLLTTVEDVSTTFLAGTVAYLVAFSVTDAFHHAVIAGFLLFVGLLAHFVLLPRLIETHLDLSNEQLEFIVQNYRADLCADLRRAASDA